jgi:methanogenic corrinoid protein MtbC1
LQGTGSAGIQIDNAGPDWGRQVSEAVSSPSPSSEEETVDFSHAQQQLRTAIEDTDYDAGVALARTALAEGVTPEELFHQVIEPVMKDIGDAFARLDVFLPDLMRAGAVVKAIQQQVLEPAILAQGGTSSSLGKVIIGTTQGDIHDIGKNMVALMLQVNGFTVVDLGTNVTPQTFLDSARRERADIIAMSALLTPSLPYIKDVVNRLVGYGERDRYLVIAGGAPITREWVSSVGLDGFGEDAVGAVTVCRDLMSRRREAQA